MEFLKNKLLEIITNIEFWFKTLKLFTIYPTAQQVFYPGCSMVAADFPLVLEMYKYLKKRNPNIGIWFDCCGMPQQLYAATEVDKLHLERVVKTIKKNNITEVIAACGYCDRIFTQIRDEKGIDIKVTPICAILLEDSWEISDEDKKKEFVYHSPCCFEANPNIKKNIDKLVGRTDLKIVHAKDSNLVPQCCLHKTSFAPWITNNLKDKNLITFCGYCVVKLSKKFETKHLFQLLFKSKTKVRSHSLISKFIHYRKFIKEFRKMDKN